MRTRVGMLAVVGLVSLAPPAFADSTELQNDSWENNQVLAFQDGFIADEAAAVGLTPSGVGPWRVDYIYFPFGPDEVERDVTLEIYNETGAPSPPGQPLFDGVYLATGSTSAAAAYNVSGENIEVNGPFRVAVRFSAAGKPCVARDNDGNSPPNYIDADGLGWRRSSTLGVAGDWIIRAGVTDLGAGGDTTPPNIGDNSGPKSSGCQTGGDIFGGGLWLLLLLLFASRMVRRRA